MKQVRVIDAGAYQGDILNGKVYDVVDESAEYICVRNEINNNRACYVKSRFEVVAAEPAMTATEVMANALAPELVRKFETGATRSADAGRYDPEGFLSPIAIERFSLYMAKHQKQPDGTVRASDNWQKGIPIDSYMKGMWRHFLHLWTRHRGYTVQDPMAAASIEEDLSALLFNVQGMLHEVVKARMEAERAKQA